MRHSSLALAAFLVLLSVVQRGFTENTTKGDNRSEIEIIRDYELNKIKEKILAQLGLTEPLPSITSQVEIGPSELEEYQLLSSLESTETYKDSATTPTVLILHSFKGTLQADEDFSGLTRAQQSYTASFTFTWPQNGKLQKIELILYHVSSSTEDSDTPTVVLSEVRDVKSKQFTTVPISTVKMAAREGYGKYDITGDIGKWLDKYKSDNRVDLHLNIMVYKMDINHFSRKQREFIVNMNDSYEMPRLVLSMEREGMNGQDEIRSDRRRRQASEETTSETTQYCNDTVKFCCLKKLVLNFTELEFDKIIHSPQILETGYCEGSCIPHRRLFKLGSSTTYEFPRDGKPCCVVKEADPFTFIHSNGSTVKQKGIIPRSCTCR